MLASISMKPTKPNPMTVSEFARMGGHARKKALSKTQLSEHARKMARASALVRSAKKISKEKRKISVDSVQAS